MAHHRVQSRIDLAAMLDGEIADAARTIDGVGCDALGGAGIDAARARAAVIERGNRGRRKARIGTRFKRQGGEQFTQQHVGTKLRMNDQRVLAHPAQPSPRGMLPLHHRRGVDRGTKQMLRKLFTQRVSQLMQTILHDTVIVIALCVPGDAARNHSQVPSSEFRVSS